MRRLPSALRAWALFAILPACSAAGKRSTATGDPCVPSAHDCIDGLCVALDNQSGFCSKDCSRDGKCPAGLRCEDGGRWGLICKRPQTCTDDLSCPSGHVCDPSSGECFIKVARQLCAPCTHDRQCPGDGACFLVPASGERYCTGPCAPDGACPEGFTCTNVPLLKTGAPEQLRRQCVPDNRQGTCEGGRGLCSPCKGDSECGGLFDLCVRNVVSGESFCGKSCAPGRKEDCPDGFGCVDLSGGGAGPSQCVPNSNTCRAYCDTKTDQQQILQCGLGRECDVPNRTCRIATDGRQCAPCKDNDDCRKAGRESNECVLNNCASCPQRGETFCAEPCPPQGGDQECKARFGPGFTCVAVGRSTFCVPQRGTCVGGLGRLGDSCSAKGAQDCVTGLCLSYGKTALCSATCAVDADCGDKGRFRCCELAGDFYDCSPAKRNAAGTGPVSTSGVCAPNGGQFGDDCSPGRPPCQSGTCLDIGTARLCTVACGQGDSCPPDFACREALAEGKKEPLKICFPGGGGAPGSDCRFGPAACADRLCLKKSSGAVCTKGCTGGGACPTDWLCRNVETTSKGRVDACIPPDLQ